jgi:hypothetical protein
MGFTITNPVGLALPQSCVLTFEEFRSIEVNDVHEFTCTNKSGGISYTKLHFMLDKQVQRCIHYTHYKEAQNDAQSNSPTLWSKSDYLTWCRNGYATYLLSLIPVTTTPIVPVVPTLGATALYVSPAKKDDDAALISWNRKPRDVAKYPLLKNDADYQDWKLKMKRQLIADTLSRVMDPTFKIINCRTGAGMELAKLQ